MGKKPNPDTSPGQRRSRLHQHFGFLGAKRKERTASAGREAEALGAERVNQQNTTN
jgi:hypothetical protein